MTCGYCRRCGDSMYRYSHQSEWLCNDCLGFPTKPLRVKRCPGCTSATGCDDCPAERCARSSCRVERREHDDHPHACECFIDKDQARQIEKWKREATGEGRIFSYDATGGRYEEHAYERRQLEDRIYQRKPWQPPHVCTWTPHAKARGCRVLKSCCGGYKTIEPRKQIWLPGLGTHLWIATAVMWLISMTHPWQWDQLAAATGLLILAFVHLFTYEMDS